MAKVGGSRYVPSAIDLFMISPRSVRARLSRVATYSRRTIGDVKATVAAGSVEIRCEAEGGGAMRARGGSRARAIILNRWDSGYNVCTCAMYDACACCGCDHATRA